MKRLLAMVILFAAALPLSADETTLQDGVTVRLANAAEGARILGAEDAFVRNLSLMDKCVRMHRAEEPATAEYLAFLASQVESFSDDESAKVVAIVNSIRGKLAACKLSLPFPREITIVKTTGKEEADSAYCRGSAIMLPRVFVAKPRAELERTLTHELFHLLTDANPSMRPRLYAIFGFKPCGGKLTLPGDMAKRRLTNPDAFGADYCMEVTYEGSRMLVIPILVSTDASYDAQAGGDLFDYLVFGLMPVDMRGGKCASTLLNGEPVVLNPQSAPEYAQRLGGNTKYIIHPEEALAENFVLLVNNVQNVRDPQTLEALKAVLTDRVATAAAAVESSAPRETRGASGSPKAGGSK